MPNVRALFNIYRPAFYPLLPLSFQVHVKEDRFELEMSSLSSLNNSFPEYSNGAELAILAS